MQMLSLRRLRWAALCTLLSALSLSLSDALLELRSAVAAPSTIESSTVVDVESVTVVVSRRGFHVTRVASDSEFARTANFSIGAPFFSALNFVAKRTDMCAIVK